MQDHMFWSCRGSYLCTLLVPQVIVNGLDVSQWSEVVEARAVSSYSVGWTWTSMAIATRGLRTKASCNELFLILLHMYMLKINLPITLLSVNVRWLSETRGFLHRTYAIHSQVPYVIYWACLDSPHTAFICQTYIWVYIVQFPPSPTWKVELLPACCSAPISFS